MDLSMYLAKTNPDKTIREHTDDVLEELEILHRLGYIKNEHLLYLTRKACTYHDYGKANRAFQERIKNGCNFNDKQEVAHNILSMYFVNPEDFEDKDDYYRVAEVVLNHHNYGDTVEIIDREELLIQDLLSEFTSEITNIKTRVMNRIFKMSEDDTALLVKGYLHRCDYSASSGMLVEYPNDFLLQKMDEMMIRWQEEKKGGKDKIPVEWNELQKFCMDNTDENLIVTAQTGMGKTEAGLLWMGNNKGFFILPIRTAINAIYNRIREEILNKEKDIERVALLHSENLAYYAERVKEISPYEYRLRSRQLSIPITVSTLDQVFDFVFKYSGFEMKLVTLAYSKIIIDEVQMYDADLLAYLIYGISLITKFGGKVAILTATLPPFVRDLLVEKGFTGDVREESFTNEMRRHSLKVYHEKLKADYIIKKYEENRAEGKGNKILIVCNIVKNAQQLYEDIEESVEPGELHILHNKLIKMHRAEREDKIKEFGKTYGEIGEIDIQNGIWISTSIVEASLDIDFDYLFTELSDLNGLFQRLGRCNRKGVKPVSDYNCYVFTEINKNILTNGDRGFIDREIYECSKEALEEIDGIVTEEQKMQLINKYFTTEKLTKSEYIKKFYHSWERIEGLNINEMDKSDARLRNILSYTIIPFTIYEENHESIDCSLEKYDSKETSLEEKIYLKEEIMKFTMSVEPYVINARSSKSAKIERILQLGKTERIYVIDCYYTKEIGFKMKVNDGVNMW